MEILIDEAGSFTVDEAPLNSWSVVAAYAVPETEKRKYQKALSELKRRESKKYDEEIKLYKLTKRVIFYF